MCYDSSAHTKEYFTFDLVHKHVIVHVLYLLVGFWTIGPLDYRAVTFSDYRTLEPTCVVVKSQQGCVNKVV